MCRCVTHFPFTLAVELQYLTSSKTLGVKRIHRLIEICLISYRPDINMTNQTALVVYIPLCNTISRSHKYSGGTPILGHMAC